MRDPRYVLARSVLLDALEALGEQRSALIVVGAQAVYLHTGPAYAGVQGPPGSHCRGHRSPFAAACSTGQRKARSTSIASDRSV